MVDGSLPWGTRGLSEPPALCLEAIAADGNRLDRGCNTRRADCPWQSQSGAVDDTSASDGRAAPAVVPRHAAQPRKAVGHARLLGEKIEARCAQLLPSVEHNRPPGFQRLNIEGDRVVSLAAVAGEAGMRRKSPPEPPTLDQLRRAWWWVHCIDQRCRHRTPVALAPYVIRWGADASSDKLRACAVQPMRAQRGHAATSELGRAGNWAVAVSVGQGRRVPRALYPYERTKRRSGRHGVNVA